MAATDPGLIHDVEVVDVGTLRPHPRNYRGHPDDQKAHIRQSIREHGFYRNVVVARDGTILAGHGVVESAQEEGITRVPVIRLDVAPESPQAIKVLTADNELGRFAEVDDRMLAEHLKMLADLDELSGTGYDEMMLANLIYVTRAETEVPSIDHAAEWAGAGMPTFSGYDSPYRVVVGVESPDDRDRLLEMLGVTETTRRERDTWSVRWPPRKKEDTSSLFIESGE